MTIDIQFDQGAHWHFEWHGLGLWGLVKRKWDEHRRVQELRKGLIRKVHELNHSHLSFKTRHSKNIIGPMH